MADHTMIQYLRGDGNHTIGVLVAIFTEADNEVRIGWSKCNKKDNFNKEKGIKIATGRAIAQSCSKKFPSSRKFKADEITVIHVAATERNEKGEEVPIAAVSDMTVNMPVQRIIEDLPTQYKNFIDRVVTYFKAVSPDKFLVCVGSDKPEEQVELAQKYAAMVVDARNRDLDRQKIRAEKNK